MCVCVYTWECGYTCRKSLGVCIWQRDTYMQRLGRAWRRGNRDLRGVCVVFVDVRREEVWTCRYGYICIGRGNIGLRFHGEGEGHTRACGCSSGCGSGVCRGIWVCARIHGRNTYIHSRYKRVGFVCGCGCAGCESLCRAYTWG